MFDNISILFSSVHLSMDRLKTLLSPVVLKWPKRPMYLLVVTISSRVKLNSSLCWSTSSLVPVLNLFQLSVTIIWETMMARIFPPHNNSAPKRFITFNFLFLPSNSLNFAPQISKSNVVDDMVESNPVLYKPGEKPDHTVVIKYVPYVGKFIFSILK